MAQQGPRPLAHRTALRTHEAHLAANGGDALAQCNLGFMHKNGAGVAQNDEEAVKWFRLARIVMYYFEVISKCMRRNRIHIEKGKTTFCPGLSSTRYVGNLPGVQDYSWRTGCRLPMGPPDTCYLLLYLLLSMRHFARPAVQRWLYFEVLYLQIRTAG